MNKKLILSSVCVMGFVMGNAFATTSTPTQPTESTKSCGKDGHWCQIKSDVSSIGTTTADATSKAWDNSKGARDHVADNSKSAYESSKASISQSWENAKQNTKDMGDSISKWGHGVKKAALSDDTDKDMAKKDTDPITSEK
jgi:hypothetical protein